MDRPWFHLYPRQGGPNLRKTQVYPRGFAEKLYKMHSNLKVGFLIHLLGGIYIRWIHYNQSCQAKKGLELKAAVNSALKKFKQHRALKKAIPRVKDQACTD